MVQQRQRGVDPGTSPRKQPRHSAKGDHEKRAYEEVGEQTLQPFMPIDAALRQHCNIEGDLYSLVVRKHDGTFEVHHSPIEKFHAPLLNLFLDFKSKIQKLDASQPIQSGVSSLEHYSASEEDSYSYTSPGNGLLHDRDVDRRHLSSLDAAREPHSRGGRKRQKPFHPSRIHDDDHIPNNVVTRRPIQVRLSDELWLFYEKRFRQCQQLACKIIAKPWIKAIEPKKQSNHPYTGGEAKRPDWWPRDFGDGKSIRVRHKEPDHLYTSERVYLLVYMLRMVMQPPESQHADIQGFGLCVQTVEDLSHDALSPFYKESEANADKKKCLQEIFRVAKLEERYRHGKIDGETVIYVLTDDKILNSDVSESDDGSVSRDDDETEPRRPRINESRQSHSSVSTSLSQSSTAEAQYLSNLPVRGSHFSPPLMQDMATQPSNFVNAGGMAVNAGGPATVGGTGTMPIAVGSHPHDGGRRPSLYSDYAEHSNEGMYANQWQPSVTNTGSAQPVYGFSPHHTSPTPALYGVPQPAQSSYNPGAFAGVPRHSYESPHGVVFRQDDVPLPPVNSDPGYGYIHGDSRGLPGLAEVRNHLSRRQE